MARFCPAAGFQTRELSKLRNARSRRRRHGSGEFLEEIVGSLLRGAADQALAELRQLTADLRLDVIAQQRAAILVGQRHFGAPLGKAGNTSLAFTGDAIAARRVEVGKPHLALPARLDGPDFDSGDRLE